MSRKVAATMYSAIHGRRWRSASMDSTSIAGVPETYVCTPSGTSRPRSWSTTSWPPLRSASGAERIVVPSWVGCEGFSGEARPETWRVCMTMLPSCSFDAPVTTSFTGSVRKVGNASLNSSCAWRVSCVGGR